MRFSYSKPHGKHMVRPHTKIWVFYMLLAVGLSVLMARFLDREIVASSHQSEITLIESSIYGHVSERLKDRRKEIEKKVEETAHRAVYTTNIRDAIKGILEIIPDSITIQSITIDYSSLVVKGVVPSKEAFQLSLQQRLNSIFENSQVAFYPMGNGWLRFVSHNSSTMPFIDKGNE
ncbi:hypothetical protein [Helicobacter salomonis]|uniref:hypothetical protein n=1 Tax=Helicobacter salomonis TaxID=56878 RepID=UPI000CF0BCFE|nr:hypothetical protein [Helicobacter salomonis]